MKVRRNFRPAHHAARRKSERGTWHGELHCAHIPREHRERSRTRAGGQNDIRAHRDVAQPQQRCAAERNARAVQIARWRTDDIHRTAARDRADFHTPIAHFCDRDREHARRIRARERDAGNRAVRVCVGIVNRDHYRAGKAVRDRAGKRQQTKKAAERRRVTSQTQRHCFIEILGYESPTNSTGRSRTPVNLGIRKSSLRYRQPQKIP